jgi:hypothetical protein
VAVLDQQAAELARLVGGDSTRHSQQDASHAEMMPTRPRRL